MGKNGGSSWLTAVKNVFRSPEKKCPRRRDRQQDSHLVEADEEEQHQQTVFALHLIIVTVLDFLKIFIHIIYTYTVTFNIFYSLYSQNVPFPPFKLKNILHQHQRWLSMNWNFVIIDKKLIWNLELGDLHISFILKSL